MHATTPKLRPILTLAVLPLLVLGGSACAKSRQKAEQTKQPQAAAAPEMQQPATVQSVDQEGRTITLLSPAGELLPVKTSDNVDLSRLNPNDQVYVQSVDFVGLQVQPPDVATPMVTESTAEPLPEGVDYGRRVSEAVEILAVAPEGVAVTIRDTQGRVRTVESDDQDKALVSALVPGQVVQVRYTEKLTVTPEE